MGTRFLPAGGRSLLFVFGPLMFVACGGASPTAVAPTPLPSVPPQTDLRHAVASGGGYVIFFRHAARDTAVLPTPTLAVVDNAGECMPGSELTSAGIADARALGEAFQRLHIRVGRVYASPTCRTTEMARLMFSDFLTTRALAWPGMWRVDEEPELTIELRALLGTVPAPAQNTVLISHNDVMQVGRVGVNLSARAGRVGGLSPGWRWHVRACRQDHEGTMDRARDH